MDVGGPHPRDEQQDLVGEEVGGDEEEGPGVGQRLQDSVDGMEGQTRKRGQGVLLVVGVVHVMQRPVQRTPHNTQGTAKSGHPEDITSGIQM